MHLQCCGHLWSCPRCCQAALVSHFRQAASQLSSRLPHADQSDKKWRLGLLRMLSVQTWTFSGMIAGFLWTWAVSGIVGDLSDLSLCRWTIKAEFFLLTFDHGATESESESSHARASALLFLALRCGCRGWSSCQKLSFRYDIWLHDVRSCSNMDISLSLSLYIYIYIWIKYTHGVRIDKQANRNTQKDIPCM